MTQGRRVELYTDGACKGNPGTGGWAALLVEKGQETPVFGGPVRNTTNQRMELQAAIEGLKRTAPGATVRLFSDSLYLVNTMEKGWARRANNDLWAQLDELVARRSVVFQWIKGHDGHPQQEQVDKLASAAALGKAASHLSNPTPIPPLSGGSPVQQAPKLSHLDEQGQAKMVNVSAKADTERVAIAKGRVLMEAATLDLIRSGKAAKGDVLSVARVAGILGAKRTPDLIPLCHPLLITDVAVDFELDTASSAIEITGTAKTTGKTGVEMEALTAVSIAALTIYDMCKAVDRRMVIDSVRVVRKSGGKSGDLVLE